MLASWLGSTQPASCRPAAALPCAAACVSYVCLCLSLCLLQHLVIYIASLTRAVLALHDALNNRIKFREAEEAAAAGGEKKDDAAAGAGAGDKDKKDEKKEGAKDKESK